MKKTSILIVDDHPENLLTLEQLLESPELDIIRAESGNEALALTLDYEFALILLDVQMPGMDGFETAELLRSHKKTKRIPIIFVTAAHKELAHVFRGYGSGAVDYLFKPLEPTVLESKVKIFLELYRQRILLEEKTIKLDEQVLELEILKKKLEKSNTELRRLSDYDSLTNIPNRRSFDKTLIQQWQRGLRDKKPLSLVFVDIDHLKKYNDYYGQVAGDECLKRVAVQLKDSLLREVDAIARYGGEEFAAILPDTEIKGGIRVAERMLEKVVSREIEHADSSISEYVTVSVGLATMIPSVHENEVQLIEKADQALYLAKESGRNRFCIT